MNKGLVLFVWAAVMGPADAETVYRCVDEAGKVIFADHICLAGTQGGPINVQENVLDHSEWRDCRYRKEWGERWTGGPPPRGIGPRQTQNETGGRGPTEACKKAKDRYESEATSYRRDQGATLAKWHAMQIECQGYSTGPALPIPPAAYRQDDAEERRPPRGPLFSTGNPDGSLFGTDGFYQPAAGGYISPEGRFCSDAAGGMVCDGRFVPRQ